MQGFCKLQLLLALQLPGMVQSLHGGISVLPAGQRAASS
jgi:hypothetical protein